MQEPGVISEYVELLADKLSFDRSLSRYVRHEVEDHLWEAVAADDLGNTPEAQRRAVANFGDPDVIAAQFAAVSLAKQTRKVGAAIIVVTAGVFVAMKARLAWYATTQWVLADDMKAISGIVGVIDRYAFWLSVIVGIAGCAYICRCGTPAAVHPSYRRQLHRFFLLCTAATCALAVSVISDGLLTALRLSGTELSIAFVVPIVSTAIEIACAGVLVFHIRGITRRMASATVSLRT
jgi:hypothetical protein